jgi:hypothetical protein
VERIAKVDAAAAKTFEDFPREIHITFRDPSSVVRLWLYFVIP